MGIGEAGPTEGGARMTVLALQPVWELTPVFG